MVEKLNIRSLIYGVGVFAIMSILIAIIAAWVKGYVEGQLFGDAGAYSFEDHQLVRDHSLVVYFEFSSTFVRFIVTCSTVAYTARSNEIINTLCMSALISAFMAFGWFEVFPQYAFGMLVLAVFVNAVFALPIGYTFKKVRAKATNFGAIQ